MTIGPNLVIECHKCKTKLLVKTWASGNSFDATIWSDGRSQGVDDYPELTRCHDCQTFIWVYEAPVLQELPPSRFKLQEDDEIAELPSVTSLFLSDYKEALASGVCATRSNEIYVRLNIWRSYNDRTRASEPLYQQNGDRLYYQSNLIQFDALLFEKEERLEDQEEDEVEDEEEKILLRAECYRNRSEFEQSIALLSGLHGEHLQWLTRQLISACMAKKSAVFIVKQPDAFFN